MHLYEYENLYNSLSYNLPLDDLTSDEKQELVDLVVSLDNETKEIMYLLTLYDFTKTNPSTKVIFPYKIKQTASSRLEIKVDCLPIQLKRILLKFAKIAGDSIEPEPTSDLTATTQSKTEKLINSNQGPLK